LLADLENLPDPDELEKDIAEKPEAGLECFKAIIVSLNTNFPDCLIFRQTYLLYLTCTLLK
jgi:hypothetical protein